MKEKGEMKKRPIQKMPQVSRERLDQLSRLGPWDTQRWAPEGPEDERRAKMAEAEKPFWTRWEQDAVDAVADLNAAFRMRCAGSLAMAADPNRIPKRPGEWLAPEEAETYERFARWLSEMHHAGLKSYIGMVRDVVVLEETCREPGIFRRAINLHIGVRRKS